MRDFILSKVWKCEECGCEEVAHIQLSNQHSNGYWNERVQFKCSRTLRFVPNSGPSGLIDVVGTCDRSPDHKEQVKIAEKIRTDFVKLAQKRGLNEKGVNKIKDALEYLPSYV